TLHRAIDASHDAITALSALRGVVNRVLTSGTADSVWDGRDTIKAWLGQYGADFTIACGGGIRAEHLPELVRYLGAPEYHVGTAARKNGVVDSATVRQLVNVINAQ